MLKEGENRVDGVRVEVVRRRQKRINLRVGRDGSVRMSVPVWGGGGMGAAEAFLREQWGWVMRTRAKALATPATAARKATAEEMAELWRVLGELHGAWCAKLGERGVSWRLSTMKSRWGVCNWSKRSIGYSTMLATKPRELVEYVVVHELTHLQAHDHGPWFQTLMSQRLPGWRVLRKRLKG